ncbi:hypothetical protein [Nitrospira lenta]|uniref:hypothetical protein n=1 Tax=Nitrospira lenta TaxID=1436998 RepID=UPI0015E88B3B|nr:hypothetical protein [Nitrospira lenta]
MLKKTASVVLASLRGSTYRSGRLAGVGWARAVIFLSILPLPPDEAIAVVRRLG